MITTPPPQSGESAEQTGEERTGKEKR
jgi:hypothetical protein